ncbi:unnamed protein product [Lactuca virosa]|uniref:Uncharacterized protein n=1 Tax=Lactuca virosa TaxID=75947 RepID=A0AAU9NR74_9ASTR|nr:unnamed protein product [Lactuca virosa]
MANRVGKGMPPRMTNNFKWTVLAKKYWWTGLLLGFVSSLYISILEYLSSQTLCSYLLVGYLLCRWRKKIPHSRSCKGLLTSYR